MNEWITTSTGGRGRKRPLRSKASQGSTEEWEVSEKLTDGWVFLAKVDMVHSNTRIVISPWTKKKAGTERTSLGGKKRREREEVL